MLWQSHLRRTAGVLLSLLLATSLVMAAPAGKSTSSKKPVAKSGAKKTTKKARRTSRSRGQQAITSERTREIQKALLSQGYLSGKADGRWDARTKEALKRFQKDNGWQSKVVPDSRALIKLGLGPDYANALNADSIALASGGGQ